MNTSEKSATIAAALYAVHRDLENPRKDAKGQVRGRADYRYLSLPALIDHAKAALKEAQVAVIQEVTGGVGWVEVNTRFMHLTGEWLQVGPIYMPAGGDAQQVGSAITYARRYALAAALNLAADEDDDASSAKLEPGPGVVGPGDTGAGKGAADRGEVGSEAYGEGAEAPASPPKLTDAQRWMEEFHPGKPHKLVVSEKVPTLSYCAQKTVGAASCPYAVEKAA